MKPYYANYNRWNYSYSPVASGTNYFDVLFKQLPKAFDITHVELVVIDPDRRARASIERQRGSLAANAWPIKLTRRIVLADVETRVLDKTDVGRMGFIAGLHLPLLKQQQYFGHLRLLSRSGHRFQAGMAMDFMEHLAAVVAACFELVMQAEEIERLAHTDPLTNVMNRRGFRQAFQQEASRASRDGSMLGFALLDIDHFKHINDVHGHLTGDRVLKQLCDLLRRVLRPSDHVGRMGGEEFMLLLPGCDHEHLVAIMERIRDIIAHTPFTGIEGEALVVTVSGGIGSVKPQQQGELSLESITKPLDESLYQAKQDGRNKMMATVF